MLLPPQAIMPRFSTRWRGAFRFSIITSSVC
jgi:hypothetical protein